MDTLGKRVKLRRQALQLSQTELAKAVGISQQSLYKIEAGITENPRDLSKIAKALKVSPVWLAFGTTPNAILVDHKDESIPIIPWSDARELLMTGLATKLGLQVCGDAMSSSAPNTPSFPAGTIIIIDPQLPPENGKYVIATHLESPEELIFKQYIKDGGRTYLKSLNPQYPLLPLTNQIKILGVVIQSRYSL